MNPIEKALAQADAIIAQDVALDAVLNHPACRCGLPRVESALGFVGCEQWPMCRTPRFNIRTSFTGGLITGGHGAVVRYTREEAEEAVKRFTALVGRTAPEGTVYTIEEAS